MSETGYLLDVNVFLALLSEDHIHHPLVTEWFNTPHRQWAICPFTEAGFLRNATAPRPGQVSMADATATLERIREHPGYAYLPITNDWHRLCSPLLARLHGTKQVTDAYLIGLAVQHCCVLVTMDKAMMHLAGDEWSKHVLLLEGR